MKMMILKYVVLNLACLVASKIKIASSFFLAMIPQQVQHRWCGIVLLFVFPFYSAAQEPDTAYFIKNVVEKVIALNEKIEQMKPGEERIKAVNDCFQVPQDFIKEHPSSFLCIEALGMLGEGEEKSPVQLKDLEILFAGLKEEVKTSRAGLTYAAKLASLGWLSKIKNKLNDPILSGSISHTTVKQALPDVAGKKVIVKQRPPLDTLLENDAIRRNIKPSVLIVNMAYKKGIDQKVNTATAYAIDESGICVTNYHVMREYSSKDFYTSLSVTNAEGEIYPVTALLSSSESDDLVIFKVDSRGQKFKALPLSENAVEMRPIYVLGHPMQNFFHFTSGAVTGNQSETLFGKACLLMNITAEFTVGSSGGPIVDGSGNVVGTVSRKSQDGKVKMGIPVSELKKLIEFKK